MVVPTATVVPGLSGGFNGSLQHRLEVDFAEFKGLNPLVGIDSKKTPS